ncbi:MAG: MarR family transcriptional regulator [Eubacteriales bacterium]|nr:MarR family transcriptional regulator [Eubacteriales bacterium]
MNDMKPERCNQCREHCPLDALQCGKGRKYFEQIQKAGAGMDMNQNNQEDYEEGRVLKGNERHEGRRGHNGREDHEGRREHNSREDFEGCRNHKRHEGRRGYDTAWDEKGHGDGCGNGCGKENGYDEAEQSEESLAGLLCRCGYIADRKSGRQRGQKRILRILMHYPQISQKVLLEKMKIEPGSMSEVLAKLEDKGFIRREKDMNDRRKMLVTLTKEGQHAAEHYDSHNMDEGMLDILSEEEKESLRKILKKLLTHWRAERAEQGNHHHKDGRV